VNNRSIIPSASAAIAEGTLSRRLAKAETPRDFREIAELAEFAQNCVTRARLGYQKQHEYGCIRIDALEHLADALAQCPRLKGRPKSVPDPNAFATLREILGTNTAGEARKLAHLARKVAAVPYGIKRRYIAEAERHEWVVSPTGLFEFAAPIRGSQCFTDRALAKRLHQLTLDKLAENGISVDAWIEPSAGDGVFYDLLPPEGRIGIDIDPLREEFIGVDFLEFERFEPGVKYGAIGNPPWQKNGCVRFFNHAAKFCTVIAFILPRSFERDGLASRLDPRFHLLHSESLPVTLFRRGHKGQMFASLFQIWVRDDLEHSPRERPVRSHRDFEFLPRSSDYQGADIILRRVGTDAGRILQVGEIPTIANCYLIRVPPGIDIAHVRARLAAISWDDPKYLNAATGHAERGYKAISMSAVVAEYDRVTELDLWRSLTRSLVERGHGESLRRYVSDLTASRSCEV
jgi:hypothetical protein